MSEIGHNSVAKDQLRAIVERIERVEEERKGLADDVKDIFTEAKATGYDVKALRAIIRLRRQDATKRREHEAMVDLYKGGLGME
jgi:uncharacterized protein (UPF0335 family)